MDAPGREPLRVLAELLEAVLHDTHLVGLVVDRERRLVAEPFRLAAQHAAARGVEGEDPDRARRRSEHALQPLAHLAGRLVGERDREDLVRLHAHGADQVRDTMRQHARLARARTRDHEHGPFGGDDGLTLGGVEPREQLLVRCDRHRPMLDEAANGGLGLVSRCATAHAEAVCARVTRGLMQVSRTRG